MAANLPNVPYSSKSRHRQLQVSCPLSAKGGNQLERLERPLLTQSEHVQPGKPLSDHRARSSAQLICRRFDQSRDCSLIS